MKPEFMYYSCIDSKPKTPFLIMGLDMGVCSYYSIKSHEGINIKYYNVVLNSLGESLFNEHPKHLDVVIINFSNGLITFTLDGEQFPYVKYVYELNQDVINAFLIESYTDYIP